MNKQNRVWQALCILALASLAAAAFAQAPKNDVPAPYNVVLIGWDGVQRDHAKECLGRKELPNLANLAKEGAIMAIDVTTGATDTKAGWTQIVTGYDPEKTGVFSNSNYQPIPEGWSLLERVEKQFGPDNVVTVFLAGKKNHVGARGPHILMPQAKAKKKKAQGADADFEQRTIIETGEGKSQPDAGAETESGAKAKGGKKAGGKKAGGKKAGGKKANKEKTAAAESSEGKQMAGEPHLYASQHVDQFENGLGAPDNVGAKALEALDKYKDKRFVCFFHFQEPDHLGHQNGENSDQYTQGIIQDDEWLGKIVAKLKELGLYEKTRIYVAVDHGFDEGQTSHRNAPYVFFATNDPAVGKAGDRKDITPTILWRLGFDLDKIEPPLDGKPLKRSEAKEPIW